MTLFDRVAMRLIGIARHRLPDFIVGERERPYLLRWWLIPRNPLFNIYLHCFLRSDDDRALHDHPWVNCSLLLHGAYLEHVPPKGAPAEPLLRNAGDVVFRRATATHRIELLGAPCWTLFITGPRIRNWGFHCPQGWVPWQVFTAPRAYGQKGAGCGE